MQSVLCPLSAQVKAALKRSRGVVIILQRVSLKCCQDKVFFNKKQI